MDADGDSGIGDGITVQVRLPTGLIFPMQITLGSTTVKEFKVLLEQNSKISADQQQLIYKGQVLKDDQTLESYGLQADNTVHVVRRLPAVSINTSRAASRRVPIARYQEILRRMPRHLCRPPWRIFSRLATTLSRDQIEELSQRFQIQQAELWRRSPNFREMNQGRLPGNLNVRQHNILEQLELDRPPHLQHIHEVEQQNYQQLNNLYQLELIEHEMQHLQGQHGILGIEQLQPQFIEELEDAPHRGHISDSGLSSDTPSRD